MRKKITTEQFIERAMGIHGNAYEYSRVVLNGMRSKVDIICPIHGLFQQQASNHVNGMGCPDCGNDRQKITIEDFVKRSNEKHNNKYDYNAVQYKNVNTKVIIICVEHGTFKQTPKDHLRGYGCPACGGTNPVTTTEFIRRANKEHGNQYDYTKTKINGMNTNATITCHIHGDFEQRPADHVVGVGCPECGLGYRGKYSKEYFHNFPEQQDVVGILYIAKIKENWCKVGITKQNSAYDRFRSSEVSIMCEHKTTLKLAFDAEQKILDKFKEQQFRAHELRQERFAGWTECFPINMLPQLIQEINNGK